MALPAHSGPWPLVQFRNHFSQMVGLLGRVISPSQARYLNTGQHKDRINAYIHQTSMPWVGFEPTIPAFERATTVHALDRAASLTGSLHVFRVTKWRRMRWVGQLACTRNKRHIYKFVGRNYEGRPKQSMVNNSKMYLKELGREGVGRFRLLHDGI
jgi:hypothetical protein